MKKRVFVSTVAFMAFFLAYSAPTFADDLAIGQDVANRPQDRNDYQALGLPVGGFQLFPKLETNEIYNSNLYATNSNAKSDFITTIAPEIALKSQFGTHELNFSAGGDEGL